MDRRSQVNYFGDVVHIKQYVVRLDVSMDDPFSPQIYQPFNYSFHDNEFLFHILSLNFEEGLGVLLDVYDLRGDRFRSYLKEV